MPTLSTSRAGQARQRFQKWEIIVLQDQPQTDDPFRITAFLHQTVAASKSCFKPDQLYASKLVFVYCSSNYQPRIAPKNVNFI